MTFLAPLYLAAAGAAAAAVLALHFLARRRPRAAPFPTARFVPDRAASAASRAPRPTDLALLAMRVLAVLLAGAALARPVREPRRGAVARILILDRSRAIADAGEGSARLAPLAREGDALVLFDSVARVVHAGAGDTLRAPARAGAAPGSLAAALVAAVRAAPAPPTRADSLELVLASPLAAEEWDEATMRIRALWPGRIRLERVAAAAPGGGGGGQIELRGAADDPLRATLALTGARTARGEARIVRGTLAPDDSSWARGVGRVLVHWPAADHAAWSARRRPDSVGAVAAGSAVVVAPFVRARRPPEGRVVARWVDGEPAATERAVGAGCIRAVAIPVPLAGDLALREGTRRLVATLTEPCGGALRLAPAPDSLVARLAGEGPLAAARALRRAGDAPAPATPWLLAGALLLVVAEPGVRALGTMRRAEGR